MKPLAKAHDEVYGWTVWWKRNYYGAWRKLLSGQDFAWEEGIWQAARVPAFSLYRDALL